MHGLRPLFPNPAPLLGTRAVGRQSQGSPAVWPADGIARTGGAFVAARLTRQADGMDDGSQIALPDAPRHPQRLAIKFRCARPIIVQGRRFAQSPPAFRADAGNAKSGRQGFGRFSHHIGWSKGPGVSCPVVNMLVGFFHRVIGDGPVQPSQTLEAGNHPGSLPERQLERARGSARSGLKHATGMFPGHPCPLIDRQNWIASLEKTGGRPGRPSCGACQVIALSSQISSDPRCLSAVL